LTIGTLALTGCGSSISSTQAGRDASAPAAAAQHWTLEGTFQFPVSETATKLKLVATTDVLAHVASKLASKPVPLVLTGTPPTANFNLTVDPSVAVGVANPSMISLAVFQDDNDNDVNEYGEAFRQVIAAGGNGWCDGATPCTFSASFMLVPAGTYGTGSKGDFTLATAGWYYQQGCLDYSCAKLITTITQLTGAILAYSYYKDSPISSP